MTPKKLFQSVANVLLTNEVPTTLYFLFLTLDSTTQELLVHQEKWNAIEGAEEIHTFPLKESSLQELLLTNARKSFEECFQPFYWETADKQVVLVPIPFIHLPNIWIVEEVADPNPSPLNSQTKHNYREAIALVQGFMHRYMERNFLKNIPFTSLTTEQQIELSFINIVAEKLLCKGVRIGPDVWEERCSFFVESPYLLSLHLEHYQVQFRLPYCCAPNSTSLYEQQLLFLKDYLENTCRHILQRWRLSHVQQWLHEASIVSLINDFKVHNSLLHQVAQFYEKNEHQINYLEKLLMLEVKPAYKYEFYKGTTGWHIRFNGEVIRMSGNFDTGLNYIHTLISHPSDAHYANQLEVIKSGKSKDQAVIVNLSNAFSIELDIHFTKSSPVSEAELLQSIKRLSQNRPAEDRIESIIYYLSEMFYQAYCLKEISFKSEYIELFDNYKQELDEYIFILKHESDDDDFVEKVLQKSGVIKRRPRMDRQLNRTRDRVVKSIKNAINSMDASSIKEHFNQYLKIGTKSIYTPSTDDKIDWKLTID